MADSDYRNMTIVMTSVVLLLCRQVVKAISEDRDRCEQLKAAMNSLKIEEQRERRVLTSKQEKAARMTLQHEAKVNALKHDLEAGHL